MQKIIRQFLKPVVADSALLRGSDAYYGRTALKSIRPSFIGGHQ